MYCTKIDEISGKCVKTNESSTSYSLCASDEDIFGDFDEWWLSYERRSHGKKDKTQEQDKARLDRAVRMLKGIPPPPELTNPQFNINSVLEVFKQQPPITEIISNKWKPDTCPEDFGHDVYLNRNEHVEKLEHLRRKLESRFIYNQKTSLFTSWQRHNLTESAKKLSKTNGWSKSPASRVGYLKRRANFSAAAWHSATAQRTLTLDKNNRLLKSKSEGKGRVLLGASSSAGPKRALFQSPEKDSIITAQIPDQTYSIPSTSSNSSCTSNNTLSTPTRSMMRRWASKDVGRSSAPRQRSSEKKKCWRSLQFAEQEAPAAKKSQLPSTQVSKTHARKIVWAATELLKTEGISSKEPEYKSLCSLIIKETTKHWMKNFESVPRERWLNKESSTSSLMVMVARDLLPAVELQAGVTLADIRARHIVISSDTDQGTPPPRQVRPPSTLSDSGSSRLRSCEIAGRASSDSSTIYQSSSACSPVKDITADSEGSTSLTKTSEEPSDLSPDDSIGHFRNVGDKDSGLGLEVERYDSSERTKRKREDSSSESDEKRPCLSSDAEVPPGKENDSGLENSAEPDSQDDSFVIRLKRTSRYEWSSELKKKRFPRDATPVQKEKHEHFLELEGPFKYRIYERAQGGEFVSIVLNGKAHKESCNRLVKPGDVTSNCILVKELDEGLELKVPFVLFENELVPLTPITVCNMLGDIVEDALSRLNCDEGFPGFREHEIQLAQLNSVCMNDRIKLFKNTGSLVPKPLFTQYNYAIVTKSPSNGEEYYQIFVEIPKKNMFLMKRVVNKGKIILVRPVESESPLMIKLEFNIPVHLVSYSLNILEDLQTT